MEPYHATLLGIIVQTVIFLLSGYAMVIRNDAKRKASTDGLEDKVNDMKHQLEKLAEVITTQAVQTTRLDNLSSLLSSIEHRIEDLRRGRGFVKGEVDGEYPRRD